MSHEHLVTTYLLILNDSTHSCITYAFIQLTRTNIYIDIDIRCDCCSANNLDMHQDLQSTLTCNVSPYFNKYSMQSRGIPLRKLREKWGETNSNIKIYYTEQASYKKKTSPRGVTFGGDCSIDEVVRGQ